MSSETPLSASYARAARFVWLTLVIMISFIVCLSVWGGFERTVTLNYRAAVENWFAGEPLYNMSGHGFLYFPQAALVFAPWAMLPHLATELVWRWSIIGVLALSVARLTRLMNGDGRWYFVLSISTALMGWGCARNGQSTILMTGLMILAAADLSDARWWRATILLSLAFAVKPLSVVLILLAAVIYPKMSWRLAIGLLLVAVAPFAMQRFDYVISQYIACYQSLQVTFDVGETEKWAQLFGMLQVFGIDIPAPARTVLRLVAAAATLLVCWKASRHLTPQRSAYYLYSLAACYLMLFNSRTEGNTYAMVGPVFGVLLAEALFQSIKKMAVAWMMIAAIVLSVLNYDLAILVSSRADAIWISPLVCVGVTGYLLVRLFQDLRNARLADNDAANDRRTAHDPTQQSAAA